MQLTSQRIEKVDVDVKLKEDSTLDPEKDSVIEDGLASNLRNAITGFLLKYAETNDIQSIAINYHLEDN